jgi:hypothetical protein
MFECLRKFFKKPEPRNVLVIGHDIKKPGAVVMNYGNEYMYNSKVAHMVKGMIPEIDVCFYNELEKDYVVISDKGFIALELHCNAYNGYVSGAEVLVLKDDRISMEYAQDFLSMLCERFGKRNRGVKELSDGDRGYANLERAKVKGARIAVIVEPFFGDNHDDVINPAEYADFLVDWFKS